MSLPDPITRREQYLNIAAGGTGSLPPHPITREEQYLAAIADGSGGGGLPPVTSSDNGKALTVVDGSWAAADNDFVVTFTKSGGTWSADKDPAEIDDAITAKKRVYGKVNGNSVTSDSAISNFTLLLPLSAGTLLTGFTFGGAYQSSANTVFVTIHQAFNAQFQPQVTAYTKTVAIPDAIAPAPLYVDYTITGQPIGNTYPLTTSTSYASIVAALTAGREVVAVLTSGTQELRMRLVSMNSDPSTGYVAFSAVTGHIASSGTLALYQIEHTVDESVHGLIVPLITGTMTYNSGTNTLAFTQ